jgi:hypothetical protein
VLKKTGADVVSCNASEALELVALRRFDLVVLCHSVSTIEAERIADNVHKHSGKTRVLMVISGLNADVTASSSKVNAMTLPDPARLIARAAELLEGLPNHHLREVVNGQPNVAGL